MPRAVIYARVSSERQEEQRTIESQVAELRAACERAGDRIVHEYLDDGVSGATLVRPELDRMRDDARRGTFDRVYMLSPDRLARRYIYQAIVIEELRKHDIEVRFLDKAVTDRPEDQLLLGMQGLISEYERAQILERTRRGRLFRARRGEIMGGPAPFGYRYVHKTADQPARYEIDEAQATVVRLIFDLYLRHESVNKIVIELDRAGIRPPGAGNYWARSVLHRLLHRESYIGLSHYNKDEQVGATRRRRSRDEWIPLEVPPIISREVFQAAQRLLAEHKPSRKTRVYLLTGLMKCARCGSGYGGTRPGPGRYAYYRCNNDEKEFPRPRTCDAPFVRVDRIEPAVLSTLESTIAESGVLAEHVLALFERAREKARQAPDRGDRARELAALEQKERRTLDLYVDGAITREELEQRRRRLAAERERFADGEDEPAAVPTEADRERVMQGLEHFARLARERLRDLAPERQRAFLRQVIGRVTYDPTNSTAHVVVLVPADLDATGPLRHTPGVGAPTTRSNTFQLELVTQV